MVKNVRTRIEGDILTITIDLSKSFGLSGSGKSEIIATTAGNMTIPGTNDIKLGLNCYQSAGNGRGKYHDIYDEE